MTVREVVSSSEFENEINKKILTVAKFGADWCGPCRMIAPVVEQLAKKYPNVNFIQINTDKSQWTAQRGVSALPTFQFYVSGKMLDELRGANPQELESKVVRHKVEAPQAFTGQGFTLGANNNAMSESDFREARLKAFQSANPKPSVQSNTSVFSNANDNADMDVEDPELAKALALSIAESQPNLSTTSAPPASIPIKSETANNVLSAEEQDKLDTAEAIAAQAEEDNAWGEEMVPVPVNTELLQELIEMGFSDIRARKGLVHGQTLEGALQWIDEHQDDPDIDQPYMVKKSDTMPKPVLTEEQKQQKLKDMKEKIQARKAEKSKFEKEAEIQREKERRERGKNMTEVQEERDKLIRKRELEKQKKEKMDAEKERQRLRAEIARDKELRKLNKGVLPSVLGIDGYNPSAVQYEQTAEGTVPPPTGSSTNTTSSTPVLTTVKPATPAIVPKKVIPTSDTTTQISVTTMSIDERIQKIHSAIATLMKYRTGGDGGNALKLLITFVKNIHDNPQEMKYRSINTESNAYKSKFGPLVGPSMILKMLGFIKSPEDATKLILEGDIDMNLFNSTTTKLIQAENTYRHMNS